MKITQYRLWQRDRFRYLSIRENFNTIHYFRNLNYVLLQLSETDSYTLAEVNL